MAKNQADLTKWALQKSTEYLESAKINLEAKRLYPAAEEVFRSTENSLEAILYTQGITTIEYPGTRGKFTGRLALQFLIRDTSTNRHHRQNNIREIHGNGQQTTQSRIPTTYYFHRKRNHQTR
jgi:uncharacterized protein (UPF0332 family)